MMPERDAMPGATTTVMASADAGAMLPRDHPQRTELNDEAHARPPEPLTGPARLSYLALFGDAAQRDAGWDAVGDLCRRYGVQPPDGRANHYSADLGPFRLKWERHTEFYRCTFIVAGETEDPFAQPAIAAVPADWVAALPGEVMVAAHAALLPADDDPLDVPAIGARWFGGNVLIGAAVSGGAATALTDFRIHAD